VEQEDSRWNVAINLVLEIETTSTDFISHAFFPFVSHNTAWGYVVDEKDMTSTLALDSADTEKTFDFVDLGNSTEKPNFLQSSQQEAHLVALKKLLSTIDLFSSHKIEIKIKKKIGVNSTEIEEYKSQNFDLFDEPVLFLGHSVKFPGMRQFHVSNSTLSLYIPLQRMVSKLFKYAAMGGVNMKPSLSFLQQSKDISKFALITLADMPLRCLSFAAQVKCGMWKKNGTAAENLAYNYGRAVLSKTFRSCDINSIQVATLGLGGDAILSLAVDRFEVATVLESFSYYFLPGPNNVDALKEYKASLLSELLKVLSNVAMYVPTTFGVQSVDTHKKFETLKTSIAREVVHHVLSGEMQRDSPTGDAAVKNVAFSQLLRVKNIVATSRHVSESMIKEVVDEYCLQKHGAVEEEETVSYELSIKGMFSGHAFCVIKANMCVRV
jgi:hypothetical protein